MENMITVVENTANPVIVVVEKKETYTKKELAPLREEIAGYVEEIKFHKSEARKLSGKERHDKHLHARKLRAKVRARYLIYALLRGKDLAKVEQSWYDDWNRAYNAANAILFFIPKDQDRYWRLEDIQKKLQAPYTPDLKNPQKWVLKEP